MKKAKSLPSGRGARLTQFGGLLTQVASNVAVDSVKSLSKGKIPNIKELLLTSKNIHHLAERLAHLRGAAMKMGQLLSMDAGELLPPELNQLLAVLRDNACVLPEEQLVQTMSQLLGNNWQMQFSQFDLNPFAAASIGQVHLAESLTGEKLAVKIQYPGVAKSIHSDVDNVGTLIRMSGLVPENIDLTRLLLEVKIQLIREADYEIEARFLNRYASLLKDEKGFVVPTLYSELCNEAMLTMSYESGEDIEVLSELPQAQKNQLCAQLVKLLFRELFEFRLMQTDPNFANYRYQRDSQKIVLLDFGATREISEALSHFYRDVARAVLSGDVDTVYRLATELGFYQSDVPVEFTEEMQNTLTIAFEPMQYDGDYDFAASDVLPKLKDRAMKHARLREYFGTPPADAIFIHRKIAGIYLLLCRVKAQLNLNKILAEFL
ncbi:ABC1 kinase family protein [Planctobacterium marinum]|uniref:Ubiquinol-cytochrome c reductase n=1 Tax=Planctobacterium marinum TaxID=1631968 RepID=A0AA48KS36_9ALTE|nr:ubiquinol-cytochrome c reductase [Planctobacterium marinum]